MAATTYMIWAGSGGALVLLGLALALYGLFWDRSNGRKRCPACAYSMEGLPSLTCPECGKVARSERALHRTRRRWRTALFGLLAVPMGAGAVVWPIARAKDPWPLLPHVVQGWLVARSDWLSERRRTELFTAFIRPSLTPTEYVRVVRRHADLMRQPASPSSIMTYRYTLGAPRMVPDGTVSVMAGRFAGMMPDAGNAYSLLPASVAIDLAESLTRHWRDTLTFDGKMSGQELSLLAYWNPAVAEWSLRKLFEEPVGWVVYAVDPRAGNGAALDQLLREYEGPDAARRSRAAAVLQIAYLDGQFRSWTWTSQASQVKGQYPLYDELAAASAPAGDDLLGVALNGSGDDQRIAVLAITDHRVLWQRQVNMLRLQAERLPPELVELLVNRRP